MNVPRVGTPAAVQRTLTPIAFDLPIAPLLSVTESRALKLPVRTYMCGVIPGIAPAFETLPVEGNGEMRTGRHPTAGRRDQSGG